MNDFLLGSAIFLSIAVLFSMFRVVKGPSNGDRIIGINVIGTKTMVIMAIISSVLKEQYFLDVVLVYALISFIASFIVSREIYENSNGDDLNE
ncbi:MAG: cation:proton antiporter [Clostridiales bacterium]|nr:cation:proton antiporter [Clostridiales bacterium]